MGKGCVLSKRLLNDVMLSGLQNGIQWEIKGGILYFMKGCCGGSRAFLLKWGTNGGLPHGKGIFVVLLL